MFQAAAAALPQAPGGPCMPKTAPKLAGVAGGKQLEEQPQQQFHVGSTFCTARVGKSNVSQLEGAEILHTWTETLNFALTWFLAAKDPSGEPQMFISSALG